jgi:ethanolamine utilization protein EutP (predicted NTPase)
MPIQPNNSKAELEAARAALTQLCADLQQAGADDESMRQLVHQARALLDPAPFHVVACGEYGRGKSTLLSALAGQRQLFPHEPNDTTAIATTLAWGEEAEAVVTLDDEKTGQRQQVTVPLDAVRRYVTERTTSAGGQCVLLVEMTAPLEALRSGLVLVDTPGVNSRNEAHNVATREYLSSADAILFVASVDEPLTILELEVLREVAAQCPQIVAVLTKIDMGGAAELAASASERIGQVLGRPVDVQPVSAVMALDALDEYLPGLEDESQLPELRRRLAALRNAHAARTALEAGPPLVRAITLQAEPFLRELEMLREAASQDDVVEREMDRVRDQITALDARAAAFRKAISGKVRTGLDRIGNDVRRQCQDVISRITEDQKLAAPVMQPDAYLRSILNSVMVIATKADGQRQHLIADIARQAQPLTEAELVPSAEADSLQSALPQLTQAFPAGAPPRFSFTAVVAGLTTGAKVAVVTGSVGGLIGSMVVPGVGTAAGATIGALLGHMAGWVGGSRDAIRQAQQDYRANNSKTLADITQTWVNRAAHDMDEWIRAAAPTTTDRLRAGFDAAVNERRSQLTSLLSAAPGLADTGGARQARIDEVAGRIARYEELSRDLAGHVECLELLAAADAPLAGAAEA